MSIQSEINRIEQNVADTYSVLSEAGAPMPASMDSDNLAGTAANIAAVLYNQAQSLTSEEQVQARLNIGVTGQVSPEYASSLTWLEENGDTSKLYVLTDETNPNYGYIYAYILTKTEVESGPSYTNVLPAATDTDGTIYNGIGYKAGTRLSGSSGTTVAADALMCASGFIPAKVGDVLRIKGAFPVQNVSAYVVSYNNSKSRINNQTLGQDTAGKGDTPTWETPTGLNWFPVNTWYTLENINCLVINLTSANFGTDIAFIRFSGHMDENTIVTINQEISEGGGTTIVEEYKWANTGLRFVSGNYDDEINDLQIQVETNTEDIADLKKGINTDIADNPLGFIRNWDSPIYDKQNVFLLSTDKPSASNYAKTPDDIYARYDALMAENPEFITKTDLGLCSDGINHVYRYDFKELDPHHQAGFPWSETKSKAILISGIHFEWGGIYSLYYALSEITTNPALAEVRRNVHLIVIPCCNPYATIASNYQSGLSTPNSYGVRNANGVEIHRNFEVDWVLTEAGTTHYGGPEPLSEIETQYINTVMSENPDAAFFMSSHSYQTDTTWGVSVMWMSSATNYMCNMGFRLIDKLSSAWVQKYGETLIDSIEANKTAELASGDYRLGLSQLSNTPGSEQKQATKYGIQGFNLEIADVMTVFEATGLSASTISRGTEVYANMLSTAFANYNYKDKKEYSLNN